MRACTARQTKFKLHLYYAGLVQHNRVMNLLQSVPAKARSVAVNMALTRLYHQLGMERRLAMTACKDVVRK